ncbi:MAG: hypothetical protein GY714_09835 [Desulfobacterales bacterium]|nr:hypothetical protein [Desulfobacterales bacterium]
MLIYRLSMCIAKAGIEIPDDFVKSISNYDEFKKLDEIFFKSNPYKYIAYMKDNKILLAYSKKPPVKISKSEIIFASFKNKSGQFVTYPINIDQKLNIDDLIKKDGIMLSNSFLLTKSVE